MAEPIANDWFIVEVHWRGAHEEPRYHLSGIAHGHPKIPNGHWFISTVLQCVDQTNQKAQTQNTLYLLGPRLDASDVRASDLQRINDYLGGLWLPPKSLRLALTIPASLLTKNRH